MTDTYRGMSTITREWKYGGIQYDKATGIIHIISESGTTTPIIPITFGKRMMVGSMPLYHGDLVMWCKFRNVKQAPQRIEDILFGEIGVVYQEENDVRISEDIHSCGALLEELRKEHIKVVGNIFETGLDQIGEDFYLAPDPEFIAGT